MNHGNVGVTEGIMSPSPDEMERKDFSLPVINTVGGGMAANSNSYIPEMTERSHDPIRTGSKCLHFVFVYNCNLFVKRFADQLSLFMFSVADFPLFQRTPHT